MGPNFLECDREQVLLLPPSLREWLPEDHLAWFVIDAVEQLDLTAFYTAYRLDGQGRAAHEPAMMVALLLYSYAVGERSGRPYAFMRRVLATDLGGELYARRQTMIEPVFAHTKFNRRCDRFLRRGRSACRSEWRLINATHNLLKLYKHTTAPALTT